MVRFGYCQTYIYSILGQEEHSEPWREDFHVDLSSNLLDDKVNSKSGNIGGNKKIAQIYFQH